MLNCINVISMLLPGLGKSWKLTFQVHESDMPHFPKPIFSFVEEQTMNRSIRDGDRRGKPDGEDGQAKPLDISILGRCHESCVRTW